MSMKKKLFTFVSLLTLMTATVSIGGNMAVAEEVTITVLESAACSDDATTVTTNRATTGWAFPTFTGSAAQGFLSPTGNLNITMDVNECLSAWMLTASVTDFHSADHGFSPAPYFGVSAPSTSAQVVGTNGLPVPGTTPLPWATWTSFTSAGEGSNLSTADAAISTGSDESHGLMYQTIRMRLYYLPNATPPGTYDATMTLTFTGSMP
jgi:hypothetical protein